MDRMKGWESRGIASIQEGKTHDTSLVNLLSSGVFILIDQVLSSALALTESEQRDVPCSNSPP
jgi:hypothetical protein